MNYEIRKGSYQSYDGDALVALQYERKPSVKGPLGKVVKEACDRGYFKGAEGELFQIFPCHGAAVSRLLLVGLGGKGKSNDENIRKAAGLAIRNLQGQERIAFLPLDNPARTIAPLIEGAILGSYRFESLKSEKGDKAPQHISFLTGDVSVSSSTAATARAGAEAACLARDLANLPANLLTPLKLSQEARKLGEKYRIPVEILTEAQMRKLKMGALLAVAQGSSNRPRMVVWKYNRGRSKTAPIALVGKGVTFDTGGISLKRAEAMADMKMDMSGAATVISLIQVLGQLKPKINVVGIAPLVENMPSGAASRPGDVVTASNGRTIEIVSTDAEGRMILADALVYAKRFNPRYVVDIATLTGACSIALGTNIVAGLVGTDRRLINALTRAGDQTGERLWELPLWDDYGELIKSSCADMKNSGGKYGGAITAGYFLSRFADGYPWAHVDMAGMDYEDKNHPYRWKGATGWGVRLLSRFLLNQAGHRS